MTGIRVSCLVGSLILLTIITIKENTHSTEVNTVYTTPNHMRVFISYTGYW